VMIAMGILSHRPFAEKYAADQDAFFQDYAQSHVKLSEVRVAMEFVYHLWCGCVSDHISR
jgi:hypothetical protein